MQGHLDSIHWAFNRWLSRLSLLNKELVHAEKWAPDRPLISIVIPCYNHGHYLTEAVDSVLAQTWQDFEIIIVNDASDDENTLAILSSFARPKTCILHHTENLGLPSARNTGIRQAQGKYICCLDADDKIHPTYLEKALFFLEADYGFSIFYSWVQVFGDEDRVWYAPQFDPASIPSYNQIVATGVFRRTAWEAVGGYREEMRWGYEDWEFWVRLARRGYRGYRIPEKMIHVRRVGKSFVHAAMERHDQLVADIRNYNPDVYYNLNWAEEFKLAYRNQYVDAQFVNMSDSKDYLAFQNPLLWVNLDPVERFKRNLSEVLERIRSHQGDFIFVSLRLFDEQTTDALFASTPYVYILPHFLPHYQWTAFVDSMLVKTRGLWQRA